MKHLFYLALLFGTVFLIGCAATPTVSPQPNIAAVRTQNKETQKHITKTQHDISSVQERLKAIRQNADAANSNMEIVGKDLDALLKQK